MHTFVINLQRSTEHRKLMDTIFSNTLFKIEFSDAVDGKEPTQEFLKK